VTKTTLSHLREKKVRGEKIAVLTAYDYPMACLEDEAGVDAVLVGDSLGTNVLGYQNETQVSMADMIHHLKAVRRGVKRAYLLADLPYQTYTTPTQALENARALCARGADGVKLEGALPEIVRHLRQNNIEVCAHLGYTPQTHLKAGLRARTSTEARQLVEDAQALQRAGAEWVVLEMVPEEVGRCVTESVSIPTIGIGAGKFTDGQVLIVLDILGLTPFDLRHNKKYAEFRDRGLEAIRAYVNEVRNGEFPGQEHARHMSEEELSKFNCSPAPWAQRS